MVAAIVNRVCVRVCVCVGGSISVLGWTGQPLGLFHEGDQFLALNDLLTCSMADFHAYLSRTLKKQVSMFGMSVGTSSFIPTDIWCSYTTCHSRLFSCTNVFVGESSISTLIHC